MALPALVSADPASELQDAQQKLTEVQDKKAAAAKTIDEANRQIDQLIGQESALRQRESAVAAALSAKQAELDKTTARLKAEQKQLEIVRARLQRALDVLRKWVVAAYKTDSPDVVSIALNSASWSDLVATSDYLGRIQNSDEVIAQRIDSLREQTHEAVVHFTATKASLTKQRNTIAAQKKQVSSARAAVAARHSQLAAAQTQRRRLIAALGGQEKSLSGKVAKLSEQQSGPPQAITLPVHVTPGTQAKLVNGEAFAPKSAPAAVKGAIGAANAIRTKPYVWGGGHGSFVASGYDCSGAVSYALHGGGLLSSPLDSTGLEFWGAPGPGKWITVYANSGHAYAVIAGLRWDTSGTGGNGPRWSTSLADGNGPFVTRHPPGL
jgi:cell wall-associated NlpC family hydrolase